MGEGGDAGVQVVDPLDNARSLEGKDLLPDFPAVFSGKDKLRLAGSGNPDLGIPVYIPIGILLMSSAIPAFSAASQASSSVSSGSVITILLYISP